MIRLLRKDIREQTTAQHVDTSRSQMEGVEALKEIHASRSGLANELHVDAAALLAAAVDFF